jgi:hypothetical protein
LAVSLVDFSMVSFWVDDPINWFWVDDPIDWFWVDDPTVDDRVCLIGNLSIKSAADSLPPREAIDFAVLGILIFSL